MVPWCCCLASTSWRTLLRPHGLQPSRCVCPWDFSQQECQSELPFPFRGGVPDSGIKSTFPALAGKFFTTEQPGKPIALHKPLFGDLLWESVLLLFLLLLLSHFSRVWLCATPETAAHQAPPSLGFSRQEHWSGLPFPSPMHESEKWKSSRSVMSDS